MEHQDALNLCSYTTFDNISPQKCGHPNKFVMLVYSILKDLDNSKLNASDDDYKIFQCIISWRCYSVSLSPEEFSITN
jgi:hypothetical protein